MKVKVFIMLIALIASQLIFTESLQARSIDYSNNLFQYKIHDVVLDDSYNPGKKVELNIVIENTGGLTWNGLEQGANRPLHELGFVINGEAGYSTAILSTVKSGEFTSPAQTLKMTMPRIEGVYEVELFLYDSEWGDVIFMDDADTFYVNVEQDAVQMNPIRPGDPRPFDVCHSLSCFWR